MEVNAAPVLVATTDVLKTARVTINNVATCPRSNLSKCVIRTYVDDVTGAVTGTVGEELTAPNPTDRNIENLTYEDANEFHNHITSTLENGGGVALVP